MSSMQRWVFLQTFAFLGLFIAIAFCRQVEKQTDSQLLQAVKDNQFVLAILHTGGCQTEDCRSSLEQVQRVAESKFLSNMKVVHVSQSTIARKLSTDSRPLLIFYRKSVPILFDGEMIEQDSIFTWMENNKERNSRPLDSTNFEHLTQASTGATTGDWLVLFQKESCNDLMPMWETVASRLKHRMNVATVDISSCADLKARFHINKCPLVLFFRLGKMYFYNLDVKELNSFVSFAEGWYTNAPSKSVPKEPTPFDVLVDEVVTSLKKTDFEVMRLPLIGIVSITMLVMVLLCLRHWTRSPHKTDIKSD